MFVDRVLKCVECRVTFTFSAAEQEFFKSKNFTNDPKRCKVCKAKANGRRGARPETTVQCSQCGVVTTVPFKPTSGKPVLCRTCFSGNRTLYHLYTGKKKKLDSLVDF